MKRAEALTGKKKGWDLYCYCVLFIKRSCDWPAAVRAVDVTKPEQAASTQPDQSFKRKDGESVKAYLNRIDVESNQHIMNLHKKNRKMREARKQLVLGVWLVLGHSGIRYWGVHLLEFIYLNFQVFGKEEEKI